MTDEPPEAVVLDVRPTLATGGDPFEEIMRTVDRLAPGQDLIILNSFEPFPLYERLAARGFDHRVERFPDGDWKVTFTRTAPAG